MDYRVGQSRDTGSVGIFAGKGTRWYFAADKPNTREDKGRNPTAEPATVVKSLSLDEFVSLKPNNKINAPTLHPKVPCPRGTITPHWACPPCSL